MRKLRPKIDQTPQRSATLAMWGGRTHKNEGGIEIFIVLFLKVVIMFSHFLLELVIETGPGIGATVLPSRLQQGGAWCLL